MLGAMRLEGRGADRLGLLGLWGSGGLSLRVFLCIRVQALGIFCVFGFRV